MTDAITCPNCHRQNTLDAMVCVQCGTILNADRKLETIPVADLVQDVNPPERVAPSGLRQGTVALYVMGEREPILVKDETRIILGRSVFGEPAPTVDFTDHHGRLLGVSRHHAAVERSDDGFILEDLDSSNGTWLNDNRVENGVPAELRNGDLIRLGQLVIVIYFGETADNGTNADERRRAPAVQKNLKPDLRAAEVTLVGRPGRVDMYPEVVVASLLYLPAEHDLPEGVPNVFAAPGFYTVYIPIELWKRVEATFPHATEPFVIRGTMAYDPDVGRIAVLASSITTWRLESQQARLKKRKDRPKKRSSQKL